MVIMAWISFRDEGESVFEAPAGAVDGEHVAVVQEPVEDGGGQHVVTEEPTPFVQGFVRGQDDRPGFVALRIEISAKTMFASSRESGR